MSTVEVFAIGECAVVVLGGIMAGFRYVKNRGRKELAEEQRGKQLETLQGQTEDLAYIKAQFSRNGGSSIKDDMFELKSSVKVLATRFDDHLKQHAGEW